MTEFDAREPVVQRIWDRLRTLLGAKVHKIKTQDDLEKVAKRYKSLSKYEKTGLIRRSNITRVLKEEKMRSFIRGYKDKKGIEHKGYYKETPIRWTKKEIKALKSYKAKGRTINQMSSYLYRTPTSIKQKLKTV